MCVILVIEGMDVVKQIESQGSRSGTPKKTVQIVRSGELGEDGQPKGEL